MHLIVIMCMKEIFDHLPKQRKLNWTRTEKGGIFTFNNESEQKAAATASELYNRKSGHVERYF